MELLKDKIRSTFIKYYERENSIMDEFMNVYKELELRLNKNYLLKMTPHDYEYILNNSSRKIDNLLEFQTFQTYKKSQIFSSCDISQSCSTEFSQDHMDIEPTETTSILVTDENNKIYKKLIDELFKIFYAVSEENSNYKEINKNLLEYLFHLIKN